MLLVAAGAILWRAGELEQRMAAAERDLVTLRYDSAAATAAEAPSRLAALLPGESRTEADAADAPGHGRVLGGRLQHGRQQSAGEAARGQCGVPDAAPRRAAPGRRSSAGSIRSSRATPRSCATTPTTPRPRSITNTPSGLRAVIAARKQPVASLDMAAANLTIHGVAGAPPEASDMKKFKMIVPMRPDERLEAEKAGKGTTKVRKG